MRRKSLPLALLSSLVGIALAQGTLAAGSADGTGQQQTWLVEFAEPGLAAHLQTNAKSAGQSARVDLRSAPARQYSRALQREQLDHKRRMAQALGKDEDELQISHHYLASHSGIALSLTAQEADKLRGLPGIKAVTADRSERLDSFRGPSFIGADRVWSGTATPDTLPADGRGIVIGIIDSGITSDAGHPSFTNTAACGHSRQNAKIRSAVDCTRSSSSGRCIGPNPYDEHGHGTHVAGVAAGNRVTVRDEPELAEALPAGFDAVSGIAPCATVRSYKACPDEDECPHSAIKASLDQILLDGDVDVMNFSISGGTDPWSDYDRAKLDLVRTDIFVAASAGNNTEEDPGVTGRVGHRGPWVMSVAASSHDEAGFASGSVTGPELPAPAALEHMPLIPGSTVSATGPLHAVPARHFRDHPSAAEGCAAFPAGFFQGAAAVLRRGQCTFTEKIGNARAAGAVAVIVVNHEDGLVRMDTTGAPPTPAYSTSKASGEELIRYIISHGQATLDIHGPQGDVLADFSYRGPTPAPLQNLTKPDITAPGVNLLAAGAGDTAPWRFMGGTSASSPHVAGAAALLRSVHASWTPMQLKSALMLTARPEGTLPDGGGWGIDEVGSGRVDVAAAMRAGFVLDETFARFVAANPKGGSLDVRQLNLPSLRDLNCTPSCTWTRTVTSTLPVTASWNAGIQAPRGFQIDVSPASFPLAPGASRTLTVTARPVAPAASGHTRFGRVEFTADTGDWPALGFPVAVRGSFSGSVSPYHPAPPARPHCPAGGAPTPGCQQFERMHRAALRQACRQIGTEPLPEYCRD